MNYFVDWNSEASQCNLCPNHTILIARSECHAINVLFWIFDVAFLRVQTRTLFESRDFVPVCGRLLRSVFLLLASTTSSCRRRTCKASYNDWTKRHNRGEYILKGKYFSSGNTRQQTNRQQLRKMSSSTIGPLAGIKASVIYVYFGVTIPGNRLSVNRLWFCSFTLHIYSLVNILYSAVCTFHFVSWKSHLTQSTIEVTSGLLAVCYHYISNNLMITFVKTGARTFSRFWRIWSRSIPIQFVFFSLSKLFAV